MTTTWTAGAAAEIRRRFDASLTETDITRGLHAAGVLQPGTVAPSTEFAAWFWQSDSGWHLNPHALSDLVRKLVGVRRVLGFRAQLQLGRRALADLLGVDLAVRAPLTPSGEGSPARRAAVDDRGERGPANDPSTS